MSTWRQCYADWEAKDTMILAALFLCSMGILFWISDCVGGIKEQHAAQVTDRRYTPAYTEPGYTRITTDSHGDSHTEYHPPVYHSAEYHLTVNITDSDDGERTVAVNEGEYNATKMGDPRTLGCRRGHWTRHLYCW